MRFYTAKEISDDILGMEGETIKIPEQITATRLYSEYYSEHGLNRPRPTVRFLHLKVSQFLDVHGLYKTEHIINDAAFATLFGVDFENGVPVSARLIKEFYNEVEFQTMFEYVENESMFTVVFQDGVTNTKARKSLNS
jgi:hypothetical protein